MNNKHFEKGQYVVYASNGLCRIEDIKDMSFISGESEKKHYIIKPARGKSSTIYVPADNDRLLSKMRAAMTREDIDALLSRIKDKEIAWEDDRKIRTDNFHDILINGVGEDLMLMISCIYVKKHSMLLQNKMLSASDSKFLENAEKLVEEEFSHALEISPSEVGQYIRTALGL